jgi:hypothetical protein
MNVLQRRAIQVQYCTYMSLGSTVMPDLAVGHFCDFPSTPGRLLRLFDWQAWCLLPSPPVPPFPCGCAASSRAIRAPELGNANLLFQVCLFQHIVPPIPPGPPLTRLSTTSPVLSVSPQTLPNVLGPGFVVKVTRFAYVSFASSAVLLTSQLIPPSFRALSFRVLLTLPPPFFVCHLLYPCPVRASNECLRG